MQLTGKVLKTGCRQAYAQITVVPLAGSFAGRVVWSQIRQRHEQWSHSWWMAWKFLLAVFYQWDLFWVWISDWSVNDVTLAQKLTRSGGLLLKQSSEIIKVTQNRTQSTARQFGNELNVIFAAAKFNIRKLMRAFVLFLCRIFKLVLIEMVYKLNQYYPNRFGKRRAREKETF